MSDGMKWNRVGDKLPRHGRMVVLVNVDRRRNTTEDIDHPTGATGYWNVPYEYWSVHGQGGCSKEAFTHWMELEEPR